MNTENTNNHGPEIITRTTPARWFTVQIEAQPTCDRESVAEMTLDEISVDAHPDKLAAAGVVWDEVSDMTLEWEPLNGNALIMLICKAYGPSMDDCKDAITEHMDISLPDGWEWIEVITFASDTDEEETE